MEIISAWTALVLISNVINAQIIRNVTRALLDTIKKAVVRVATVLQCLEIFVQIVLHQVLQTHIAPSALMDTLLTTILIIAEIVR